MLKVTGYELAADIALMKKRRGKRVFGGFTMRRDFPIRSGRNGYISTAGTQRPGLFFIFGL